MVFAIGIESYGGQVLSLLCEQDILKLKLVQVPQFWVKSIIELRMYIITAEPLAWV